MNSLDIWMREHTLAYVWLGSYAVAALIFAIEIAMIMHKRKVTLRQVRLLRDLKNETDGNKTYGENN